MLSRCPWGGRTGFEGGEISVVNVVSVLLECSDCGGYECLREDEGLI